MADRSEAARAALAAAQNCVFDQFGLILATLPTSGLHIMATENLTPPDVSQAQAGLEQLVQLAMQDARVAKLYGNHFVGVQGPQDITLVLGVNGVPTGVVHISYSLARTLATGLTKMIADYEKITGVTVRDGIELENALKAKAAEKT